MNTYKNYCKNNQKNSDRQKNKTNLLSGSLQPEGCYKCCNCGQKIYLEQNKKLPNCPRCNCNMFEQEN